MKKWILIGVVILGFTLRIIGLSNHPSGFNADEASFGYDAYSILKTGKDQWGNALPLVLKSFGDDKLPVYTYITIPSVAIFGLNEFAVRLPNVILATLSILIVYFLVFELFKKENIALLSAFLLAISPWHIMLSRGAFEANLTNFFLPLGILLFLKSFENKKYLFVSFLFFLINLFTYHTARILTPLIVVFLIFNYRDKLKLSRRFNTAIILAVILFVVSGAGIILGGSRIATSTITSIDFADDRYKAQLAGEASLISKFFYNKPLYVIRQFAANYFSYFSPQFLLFDGAGEGTYGMVPGIGVIYFVEIIFLLTFLWAVVSKKELRSKNVYLIIFWILISMIPASLTKGPGYAGNRTAIVIVPLVILLGIGGIYFYNELKTKKLKQYFVVSYSILLLFNFLYLAERYVVGQEVNQAPEMAYGVKQIFSDLKNVNGKKVIISRNISEPQIFVAFYEKMDPREYQNASKNWKVVNGWVDQQGEYSLGNYTFRDINYNSDKSLKNTILVSAPKDFPIEAKPDFVINYPNTKTAYEIFEK